MPGLKELMERLSQQWYADVCLWDELLERGRPESKGGNEPPLQNDW